MTSAQSQLFSTRAGKSLIEDEAELSDWVSELKSDSFKKSRVYSESDNEGGDNDFRGGKGGRGFDGKRKRESDSDGYNGGGNKGRFDRGGGGLRGRGGRFGGEMERRNDRFSSRDMKGNNGGAFDALRKRKDDGFVPKRRDDRFDGGGGRGGRGGGRGGKSMGRGNMMVSDEDEDEDSEEEEEEEGPKNVMSKFRELISDESDDDDDDDVDDEILEKPAAVKPPKVSADGSESYLSETRY